jgi:serine/threonine-protein kinase
MEFVEGIDLYDLLDKCGQLPVDVAAVIAMQVARGLDYAHYRGIVHRDVKPANIMVSRQGVVKLMDFGIARDPSFGDLTESGTGLGTPSYMSPEQILGDKIDFRSDLFSIGIVLYQMCTGRKPFIEDDHQSVMQKIRLETPTDPRKLNPLIPNELVRIINRCLQKLPRDRYRSTQDLVNALDKFISRRVDMNYHARVVMFLRDHGVVSEKEAEPYVGPAGGLAPKAGSVVGDGLVSRIAQVQAGILGGLAVITLLIHLAPIGDRASALADALPGTVASAPDGTLRVLADPWAHVYVDGKYADTTPFAHGISVRPGHHVLTFLNDFYQPVTQEIDVDPGGEKRVHVTLSQRLDPNAPALSPPFPSGPTSAPATNAPEAMP